MDAAAPGEWTFEDLATARAWLFEFTRGSHTGADEESLARAFAAHRAKNEPTGDVHDAGDPRSPGDGTARGAASTPCAVQGGAALERRGLVYDPLVLRQGLEVIEKCSGDAWSKQAARCALDGALRRVPEAGEAEDDPRSVRAANAGHGYESSLDTAHDLASRVCAHREAEGPCSSCVRECTAALIAFDAEQNATLHEQNRNSYSAYVVSLRAEQARADASAAELASVRLMLEHEREIAKAALGELGELKTSETPSREAQSLGGDHHGAPGESLDRGETAAGPTPGPSQIVRPDAPVPAPREVGRSGGASGVEAGAPCASTPGSGSTRGELALEVLDGSYPDAFDSDGRMAPRDLKHQLWKAAEQAGKEHWWNVMSWLADAQDMARKKCRAAVDGTRSETSAPGASPHGAETAMGDRLGVTTPEGASVSPPLSTPSASIRPPWMREDESAAECAARVFAPARAAGAMLDAISETPPACTAEHCVTSQCVFRSASGVGFRFEFCCRKHSPTPFLEIEMTQEGSLRFAKDIAAVAAGANDVHRCEDSKRKAGR